MTQDQHLNDLKEIRSMMERSSRFISLSGLSGIFAGIFALIGAATAWWYLKDSPIYNYYFTLDSFSLIEYKYAKRIDFFMFIVADAALVLFFAISTGVYLTTRQAKKKGQSIWDSTSKRMLVNLAIPLITGGFFCISLLYHGVIGLIAPASLIFYGLALINASKYTLTDIRYLGFTEIVLGLVASYFIGYGLLFWAIGFGVLHIVYGTVMYFKYER